MSEQVNESIETLLIKHNEDYNLPSKEDLMRIRNLAIEIEQLQADKDALVARVARLHEALSYAMQCWEYDGISDEHGAVAIECETRLDETESESINEIRAEAVELLKFPVALRKMWSGGEVQKWLKEQANQLRNESNYG